MRFGFRAVIFAFIITTIFVIEGNSFILWKKFCCKFEFCVFFSLFMKQFSRTFFLLRQLLTNEKFSPICSFLVGIHSYKNTRYDRVWWTFVEKSKYPILICPHRPVGNSRWVASTFYWFMPYQSFRKSTLVLVRPIMLRALFVWSNTTKRSKISNFLTSLIEFGFVWPLSV